MLSEFAICIFWQIAFFIHSKFYLILFPTQFLGTSPNHSCGVSSIHFAYNMVLVKKEEHGHTATSANVSIQYSIFAKQHRVGYLVMGGVVAQALRTLSPRFYGNDVEPLAHLPQFVIGLYARTTAKAGEVDDGRLASQTLQCHGLAVDVL